MVVDSTSNFLLTGAADSNIHVWSLSSLLSFSSSTHPHGSQTSPYSPVRTLSNHRAAITALITGQSYLGTDIAISGSEDQTCIVWDYCSGDLLHTFLLPSIPLCLALDPADRALYAGFEDGSIQLINFYRDFSMTHPVHDSKLSTVPSQASPTDRWAPLAQLAYPVLSLAVSYDGASVLSGHRNGKVLSWDVGRGRHGPDVADFVGPVTNIAMLTPEGFPNPQSRRTDF